jgi:hypothetical protein
MKHLLLVFFCCFFTYSFTQDSLPAIQDTSSHSLDTIVKLSEDSVTVIPVSEELSTTIAASATELPPKKKKFTVDRVRILFGINYSFLNPVVTEKMSFKVRFIR